VDKLRNLGKRGGEIKRRPKASKGFCSDAATDCWAHNFTLLAHFAVSKAKVGIALRLCFVPILTTPMQINQLRSFTSEISFSEVVAKIKNYPASSRSKFSHYSSSIILLELLLEVAPGFRRHFSQRHYPPSRMMQSLDNLIVLVRRRT